MGLAAAEIRLQFDHRIAAFAAQAQERLGEQPLQALRDERAAEEFGGVLVFVGPFALVNLPEIGGELGLLISAGCDIRVRRDNFAPRLQPTLGLALGRLERFLSHLGTALLVEDDAHQVRSHLSDFGRDLTRGDGAQQALDRIERTDGIVAGELFVVRPLVAEYLELVHEAALGLAQGFAEDRVPLVEHHAEQMLGIVPVDLLRSIADVLARDGFPVRAKVGFELAFHKWPEPRSHQLEALADTIAIGDRHADEFLSSLRDLLHAAGLATFSCVDAAYRPAR